jgi:hypothetical protein
MRSDTEFTWKFSAIFSYLYEIIVEINSEKFLSNVS